MLYGVEPASGQSPELEERVRILFGTAFDAVLLVNDARRYVCVNDGAAELLGAPADVVLRRRIEDFTPPEHKALLEPFWDQFARGRMLEGRGPLRRFDGSQRTVDYRARWGFAPSLHLFALREARGPAPPGGGSLPRPPSQLTPREREVLQLSADGRSTIEIADELTLSPGTIKTHFQHIYDKLGTRDRVSAVAKAFRLGLIS